MARYVHWTGVAGKVAATREPILVQDVTEVRDHPLLKDEYFTSGSFISFPLVYHEIANQGNGYITDLAVFEQLVLWIIGLDRL